MYELRIVKVDGVRDNPLNGNRVINPETAMPYLEQIRDQSSEHFAVLTLNGAGDVINCRVITIGLINHSLVHPRETFRGAILDNAVSIICAHNHPSGSLEPSSQDIAVTRQLSEAGAIIGIQLSDHIIVSKTGFCSMREKGMI
jgi:DNA repair protein RadC